MVDALDLDGISRELRAIESEGDPTIPSSWSYEALRFRLWIDVLRSGGFAPPPYSIFRPGNSKLDFSAFSSMPGIDCPGAGECWRDASGEDGSGWCYSLRALRYAAATFRLLQNSILQRIPEGWQAIEEAWEALPAGVVRLFVDGDFRDLDSLRRWMAIVSTRLDLQTYGYSKSLHLFQQFDRLDSTAYPQRSELATTFPTNYHLNISSGSTWDGSTVADYVRTLPISRGDFIAVDVPAEHIRSGAYRGRDRDGHRAYAQAVRESARATGAGRVWVCPGSCRDCQPTPTGNRHACGSDAMRGVTIAIGAHG